jgi:hypothetical protein
MARDGAACPFMLQNCTAGRRNFSSGLTSHGQSTTLSADIEDQIRDCERAGDFGQQFIELARSVYQQNDRRAAIERRINQRLGPEIIEEKSYRMADASPAPP